MLIVLTIVVRSSAFECIGAILCQQIGALVMADSILLQSKYTDPKTLLLDFFFVGHLTITNYRDSF